MNVERKNAKDDLRLYIPEVIGMLKREGKFPAMHVYACTLRSYEKFCAEERHPKNTTASLSMQEIFTPERLKEYEDWLGWTTVQSEHDLHLYAYIAGGIQSLDVTGYRGVQSGAVQGCLYESGVAYQAGADGRADGATQEYGL